MLFLKEKNKETSLIILKVYVAIDKKYFQFSTGEKIKVSEWDFNSSLPKKKTGEAGKENARLRGRLERYTSFYLDTIQKRRDINILELKSAFNSEFKGLHSASYEVTAYPSDLFDLYISELQNSGTVKEPTWGQYKNAYSSFLKFEASTRKYRYAEINDDLFPKYLSFVRDLKGYQNPTMHRHLKFIKTFWRWAYNKSKQPITFQSFKYKDSIPDKIALTECELNTLFDMELKGRRAEVRDIFLVGVYTGLRFSDYSKIQKSDIQNGMLKIFSQKTEVMSSIPLHPKLKTILERYDYNLPRSRYSQNFNEVLQAICKDAGFTDKVKVTEFHGSQRVIREFERWELCSSHTARRTHISISHAKGVPDKVIMQVTGIKDIKTLMRYVHLSEGDITDAMKVWG